jgi:hypothetical protein
MTSTQKQSIVEYIKDNDSKIHLSPQEHNETLNLKIELEKALAIQDYLLKHGYNDEDINN